jgi:hypothetical protein
MTILQMRLEVTNGVFGSGIIKLAGAIHTPDPGQEVWFVARW